MTDASAAAATSAGLSPEDAAALSAYRQSLIDAEKQGQDSFDKTVLSLSGGALGISFLFIKDVIGPHPIIHPGWLLSAWICWALSTLAVLSSFYTSNRALRKAIEQCDKGTIHCEPPGGFFSRITRNLNKAGIFFLVFGIALMSAFVYTNLLQREFKREPEANPAEPANSAPYSDSTANSTRDSDASGNSDQGVRATTAATDKEVIGGPQHAD